MSFARGLPRNSTLVVLYEAFTSDSVEGAALRLVHAQARIVTRCFRTGSHRFAQTFFSHFGVSGARREECAATPERVRAFTGLKSAGLTSQVQLHDVIIPTRFGALTLCKALRPECGVSSRQERGAPQGELGSESAVTETAEQGRSPGRTWR